MDLHDIIEEILPWAIIIVPWILATWSKAKEKKSKAKQPAQPNPAALKKQSPAMKKQPAQARKARVEPLPELSLTARAVAEATAPPPRRPEPLPEEGVHSVEIAPMEPVRQERPRRSRANSELRRALVWSEILQRKF